MSAPLTDVDAEESALRAAHQQMVRRGDVQLDLPGADLNPPKPPSWLTDLLEWLGARPVSLRILFWAGVAVLTGIVVYAIYRWLSERKLSFRGERPNRREAGWWRPDAKRAEVALADADRLAEEGLYAEAAHLLLRRSVADIDERRPGELRPSLTAREIARLPALPGDIGQAFLLIAVVVEQSLFGGAAVAREGWQRARAAYAAVALSAAWAR